VLNATIPSLPLGGPPSHHQRHLSAPLAPRSAARVPRLSPRFITTMKALTSRCASTQPLGLCLIARSTSPVLRPHPGGMNTLIEDATRSPQVRRSSVPPCRPHTPCLGARSAGSLAVSLRGLGAVWSSGRQAPRFHAWPPIPSAHTLPSAGESYSPGAGVSIRRCWRRSAWSARRRAHIPP
jgi:hypothetical protein